MKFVPGYFSLLELQYEERKIQVRAGLSFGNTEDDPSLGWGMRSSLSRLGRRYWYKGRDPVRKTGDRPSRLIPHQRMWTVKRRELEM